MACCPNGIFSPLIRDCDGNIRPLQSNESLRVGDYLVPNQVLTADWTIYMSPAGNDTTGSGTQSDPFRTAQRVLEFVANIIPGTFTIKVVVEEGIIEHDDTITMFHPYGESILFEGQIETIDAPDLDCGNFDVSTSTDGDYSGVQYFDFDCTLPMGSEIEVGMFIAITSVSGGSNAPALLGLHEVIAYDSGPRDATLRVWQNLNITELPSGSITAGGELFKSVIWFPTATQGVFIENKAGVWTNLVLRGNPTAFASSEGGLCIARQASVLCGFLGITEWGKGIDSFVASVAQTFSTRLSFCGSSGISSTDTSVIKATSASIVSGISGPALSAGNTSTIVFEGDIVACGDDTVTSARGSYVDVRNVDIYYDDGTATALLATQHSTIEATGASVTGYSTTKDPAANPGTNGSYIIGP